MNQKPALTSRRLAEFFPQGLREEFVKRDKPAKKSVAKLETLIFCAVETLKRPDNGVGRKRPRKLKSRIGKMERKERVEQCQELGEIAHNVLFPPRAVLK